ncbi:MAG: proline--tRNA ligase [Candidatus Cloacimonetes bacterium]|nr:proline--tRNA ligase [Candidatus Cloacimonadota bacterium]
MAKKQRTAITPTRAEDYPQWYLNVIKAADLAENSEVRGCMVIKPWGYTIWENIQRELDEMFKDTGHVNAYFPLFIPKEYFEKEAQHVEGFAKECAIVTHTRLEDDGKGGLKVAGELTEPYIVRPTSETIIGASFAKWVNSYRDLPLLINQWANVVRWELRTRLFLRTTEFLWQEGHTVHATSEEAFEETYKMLGVYAEFAEKFLAIPVIKGEKTEGERFPGALNTFCIEAMMQDRKSLQSGTSHFLGQNFSRASNIRYLSKDGVEELAWTTSWGVSTRLVGALIMSHSDDDGLVLPPRVASAHIAIIPIYRNEEEHQQVLEYIAKITDALDNLRYHERKIRYRVDDRDLTGSDRSWQWIKKGMPIRLEIGPRDIAKNAVFMGRRDSQNKTALGWKDFTEKVCDILDEIQTNIYNKALAYREEHTRIINSKEKFYKFFTPKNQAKPEIHGGFVYAHWNGDSAIEAQIKEDLKVAIICIPLEGDKEPGRCIFTGEPSPRRVIFAKKY